MEIDNQTEKDFNTIKIYLEEARKEGLEIEVIWSALGAMKTDPSLEIDSAITHGFLEWVK